MGLIVRFLLSIFCLSFFASAEPLPVAWYNGGMVTNEDLRFYAWKQNSPLQALDLSADRFLEQSQRTRPRIENAISDLAFFDLLCRERIAQRPLNATESFDIHGRQVRYVVDEYFPLKVRQEASISQAEIEQYYREHQGDYQSPEKIQIGFIFRAAPVEEATREAVCRHLESLVSRADFNEHFELYARAYSQAPSARTGGVMDYFARGTYSPEIENPAFCLQPGQISPIVEREKGFYVIKCLDRKSAESRTVEQVEPLIKKEIVRKRLADERSRRIESARARLQPDLWSGDGPLEKGQVLVQVGDLSITRDLLERQWGPLEAAPREELRNRIQALLEDFLLFHDVVQSCSQEDPQLQRNLNILYSEKVAIDELQSEAKARIAVEEPEVRSLWEKNKSFYHRGAPKEIEYLLFAVEDSKNAEDHAYSLLSLGERAKQYRNLWMQTPQPERSFDLWAAQIVRDCSDVTRSSLGFVDRLPDTWSASLPFVEMGVGYLSTPLFTPEGIILCYVKAEGSPRILSYEEAREKVASVIWQEKYQAFRDDLRARLLNRAGFRLNF